ncbi:MAG: ABC transporter ATP-binding protein [Candidatus Omnitrophica bacterium]|nr:ABC transporter ATP-binding protein [Candidatus Omnitrophota bacterium]
MIRAKNIHKWYGSQHVLHDISFEIQEGEIVGFLGHNGAGKTTLMRILTNYSKMSDGALYIDNVLISKNTIHLREKIGYLSENPPLYPHMTVNEFLMFAVHLKNVVRKNQRRQLEKVLDQCQLRDVQNKVIATLSKGYCQRVGIAQAIINDPDILILDEPTVGLDPCQILEVRQLIKSLEKKRTVLLSTHILSEIEQMAQRVIILRSGKIVADAAIEELTSGGENRHKLKLRLRGDPARIETILKEHAGVEIEAFEAGADGVCCVLRQDISLSNGNKLFEQLLREQVEILAVDTVKHSLEDVFLTYNRK